MSVDIIRRGDYKILLIESFPCNSKDELTAREGQIIRQYKLNSECANRNIPGRTRGQYIEDNKDKIKKYIEDNKDKIREQKKVYMKEYNKNNRDKIRQYNENNREKYKEKVTCDCGTCYRKTEIKRHVNSKKHLNFMSKKL